jgi:hypothetical protein
MVAFDDFDKGREIAVALLSAAYSCPAVFFMPRKAKYGNFGLAVILFTLVIVSSSAIIFSLYYYEIIPITPRGDLAKFLANFSKWGNDPVPGYFLFWCFAATLYDYVLMTCLFQWFKVKRIKASST